MFLGNDIGIDLGTASVLVYCKGQGIVLQEPSVVAIDDNTNSIVAVGEEARKMLGKTPDNIVAIRPLREGVISNFEVTERMIRYFIGKSVGFHWFKKPRIAVCVPSKVTDVERRAVEQATKSAGAGQVFIIEEPVAAALGAGLDISRPCGSMVVDIGGGTTDVAVISLGGIVVSTSIKVAGDKFDDAIVRYMRKNHRINIGERTAENLKVILGTACADTPESKLTVKGGDMVSGLPTEIEVSSKEMYKAMSECVTAIVDAIFHVLEQTPPELCSDISDRGIVLTGGGSLISGLDRAVEERTGIRCVTAEDPISCVAIGTGKFLEYLNGGNRFTSEEIKNPEDSIDK
ncbi:MAG: rod shape-determining protein MreB [Clostridia bacterium]|nr:rod shape-determining protein MreB [Clostridia bacterium]